jgi:hypothetical protein
MNDLGSATIMNNLGYGASINPPGFWKIIIHLEYRAIMSNLDLER